MRNLLVFITLSLLLWACGGDSGQQAGKQGGAQISEADELMLKTASEKLIAAFSRDLRNELLGALNQGGPANGIRVCQTRAPEIGKMHTADYWKIRRVSDRNRNPNNRATMQEEKVLQSFAGHTELEHQHRVEWAVDEGARTYHYYKPIVTGEICLNCHGKALAPDVTSALAEMYPEDSATGYETGELRGMFVVDVIWPDGKEYAEQLLAKTSVVDDTHSD